jgi:hypothetical protein
MRYRAFRRRFSEAMATFGLLDIVTLVIGIVMFAIFVFCAWGTVELVAHFRDLDQGFPAGPGFVRGVKGLGLVLFPIFGSVALVVAWTLAGDQVGRGWRWLRGRRSS